jgi:hypothetical protein
MQRNLKRENRETPSPPITQHGGPEGERDERQVPVWSKYSNVLKPWVISSRAERLWENVTRQTWGRVTLCYAPLGIIFLV